MSLGSTLQPTFRGYVATTQDALILFEACLQGHLSYVLRRPHDRERSQLIRSGCVFIYEEHSSGIKRWTDGVIWSPSRVLGNFLIYRELDKPFPPGENKRANKNKKRRTSRPHAQLDDSSTEDGYSPTTPQLSSFGVHNSAIAMERQFIGSLVDSYGFKADGLVKKTMSVTLQGITHHLVSYYGVSDVLNNQLRTPFKTENLQYIRPRPELTSSQNFRSSLEEVDEYENQAVQAQAQGYGYGYRMRSPSYVQEYRNPYQCYYVSHSYPSMSHQQPPANYSVANAPLPPTYIQTSTSTPQIQTHRNHTYGLYENSNYNRSYDSLNNLATTVSASKSEHLTPLTLLPPHMSHRPPLKSPLYSHPQVSVELRQQLYYTPASTQSPVDDRATVTSPQEVAGSDHSLLHQERRLSWPTTSVTRER